VCPERAARVGEMGFVAQSGGWATPPKLHCLRSRCEDALDMASPNVWRRTQRYCPSQCWLEACAEDQAPGRGASVLAEAGVQGMPRRRRWKRRRTQVTQWRIGTETGSLLGLPVRMHEEEFEGTALRKTSSGCLEGCEH